MNAAVPESMCVSIGDQTAHQDAAVPTPRRKLEQEVVTGICDRPWFPMCTYQAIDMPADPYTYIAECLCTRPTHKQKPSAETLLVLK
jgi:hypothetical protein